MRSHRGAFVALALASVWLSGCASKASVTAQFVEVPVRVGPVRKIGDFPGDPPGAAQVPYQNFLAQVDNRSTLIYFGFPGGGGFVASTAGTPDDAVKKVFQGALHQCEAPCVADVEVIVVRSSGVFAPAVVSGDTSTTIYGTILQAEVPGAPEAAPVEPPAEPAQAQEPAPEASPNE